MSSLLSVVLPVFNAETYLEKCIDSILSNDYDNIELIAIDDGSTDSSGIILDELKNKYSCLKVFHTENQGVSSARNRGIYESHGEYVTFIDADDYIKQQMFSEMIHAMEQYSCDIAVCTRTRVIDGIEEKLDIDGMQVDKVSNLKIDSFHSIYDWSGACGKIYKRDIIKKSSFPSELSYGEDLFFATDVWKSASKFVYINKGYYFYRMNLNSASFTLGKKKLQDRIVASNHAWEWIKMSCPQSKKAMFDLTFGAYAAAYNEADGSEKRRFLKQYRSFFSNNIEDCFKIKGMLLFAVPHLFTMTSQIIKVYDVMKKNDN